MLKQTIKISGRRTSFITALTRDRQPIFAERRNIIIFLQSLKEMQAIKSASVLSYAVLPDHIHLIVRSLKYSSAQIIHSLKSLFTRNWKLVNRARENNLCAPGLWQPRFWEHEIQDDQDLHYHINYIIMNPVKHGYVDDPEDWPYSSFAANLTNNDLGLGDPEYAS